MSPLTTPYSGRVVRGDMSAVRTSSPAPGTNGPGEDGPNASGRGLITHGLHQTDFQYFLYGSFGFTGLGACKVSGTLPAPGRLAEGTGLK